MAAAHFPEYAVIFPPLIVIFPVSRPSFPPIAAPHCAPVQVKYPVFLSCPFMVTVAHALLLSSI